MSTVSIYGWRQGDRVRITELSRYCGRIGTIIQYMVASDSFKILVDDDRPFEVEIYIEHIEPHEDIETFSSDEFESIFEN
jgi:hypothetical protein